MTNLSEKLNKKNPLAGGGRVCAYDECGRGALGAARGRGV